MQNQFILSPFFLDDPQPELESLVKADWILNKPHTLSGTQGERLHDIHRPLADFVTAVVNQGDRPVSLAGDCCTTLAVLAGLQKANVRPLVIWFDAHGDFNTWETTPSGFLGGMPLAMMTGLGEQTMVDAVNLTPIPGEDIILSDGRDLDPGERQLIKASSLQHMPQIETLLTYSYPPRPLYIHFDTDVINLDDVPAVRYPAKGGPSPAQLRRVFQHLARTQHIVAVSISSWAPHLDTSKHSQAQCMALLDDLL